MCRLAFVLLLVLGPTAAAQDTQTFHVEPVGLNVTLPAGFVEEVRYDAPDADALLPTTRFFVNPAANTVVVARVHSHLNAWERFVWKRGLDDRFRFDRATYTRADAPALPVPVSAAFDSDADLLDGVEGHSVVAYGCEARRCYQLTVGGPSDTDREALIALLRGVRFEG